MENVFIAIIGKENSGKSSLFNLLVNDNLSLVSSCRGTTRDIRFGNFFFKDIPYKLIDTGGLNSSTVFKGEITKQTYNAIDRANLIYFVVEAHTLINLTELKIAKYLHKLRKPTILIVNKIDKINKEFVSDFAKLGFTNQVGLSCIHKQGLQELKELTHKKIFSTNKSLKSAILAPSEEKAVIRIAIVGKVNVGKSSFINKISGQYRAIVSEIPGTTTDSVIEDICYKKNVMRFIDTAGIKKRTKMHSALEEITTSKTFKEASVVDVVLIMLDGTKSLTHQDLSILYTCFEKYKRNIVLCINKCDSEGFKLNEKGLQQLLFSKLKRFIVHDGVHLISSLTGAGIEKLLSAILENYIKSITVIHQDKLKEFRQFINKTNQLLYEIKNIQLLSNSPIALAIYMPKKSILSTTQIKYLQNQFCKYFDLYNTSITILIKKVSR